MWGPWDPGLTEGLCGHLSGSEETCWGPSAGHRVKEVLELLPLCMSRCPVPLTEPLGVGTEYPGAVANPKEDGAPRTAWPASIVTRHWHRQHPRAQAGMNKREAQAPPWRPHPTPVPAKKEQDVLEAPLWRAGGREGAQRSRAELPHPLPPDSPGTEALPSAKAGCSGVSRPYPTAACAESPRTCWGRGVAGLGAWASWTHSLAGGPWHWGARVCTQPWVRVACAR